MSQENIEIVRALIPDGTDIIPLLRGGGTFAGLRFGSVLTDDFQSVIVLPGHNPTIATGPEGFRKNWLDWLEPWAAYRVTIDELIDDGERVVALTRNYGRRKDMEAEVELIAAAVLTFREGKVARWEDYADRAEALKAVKFSE